MLYQTFAQHLLHKSASAPFNTEKIKHNTMQNRQIKNKGIKITLLRFGHVIFSQPFQKINNHVIDIVTIGDKRSNRQEMIIEHRLNITT